MRQFLSFSLWEKLLENITYLIKNGAAVDAEDEEQSTAVCFFVSYLVKGDLNCVVLFKKDVVLFKNEAARENPLLRRASEVSGGEREADHSGKML